MKPEFTRNQMSAQERRLRSRLTQLFHGTGLVHGTLVERHQRCGRPNCHCVDGERHRTLVLTVRREGKSEQIYIPRHLEDIVRRWVEQDHAIRELLADLASLHTEKIRELKTRGAPSSEGS